jgi:Arc/MetJ-type ribon-helix-helix transcriptional regulator
MGAIYKMMRSAQETAIPRKMGRRKLYDSTLLVRLTAETLARIDAVRRQLDGGKREERSAVIRDAIEREIERRQREAKIERKPAKRRKRGE